MDGPAPAQTPEPPYYAAIFTSVREAEDRGYEEMAAQMFALAQEQQGFLGVESARGENRLGITVSYWSSIEDIAHWKGVAEHRIAQQRGREEWYAHYHVRIARVEREYGKHR